MPKNKISKEEQIHNAITGWMLKLHHVANGSSKSSLAQIKFYANEIKRLKDQLKAIQLEKENRKLIPIRNEFQSSISRKKIRKRLGRSIPKDKPIKLKVPDGMKIPIMGFNSLKYIPPKKR